MSKEVTCIDFVVPWRVTATPTLQIVLTIKTHDTIHVPRGYERFITPNGIF